MGDAFLSRRIVNEKITGMTKVYSLTGYSYLAAIKYTFEAGKTYIVLVSDNGEYNYPTIHGATAILIVDRNVVDIERPEGSTYIASCAMSGGNLNISYSSGCYPNAVVYELGI